MFNSTRKRILVFTTFLFSLLLSVNFASAQCPRFFDGKLILSNNPLWVSCSGANYELILQSNVSIGPFTVNFGDGSPLGVYPGLVPPAYISHIYTATIDTFNVVITTQSGCTILGKVVMEKNVNASIQIPVGGVTATCAPATLQFINSSTNVSKTTRFIWDFGDGSPLEYYDWTNAGQIVNHTYLKNTVSCETSVILSAENYCSFGNPTLATFYPIQIWDVDTAVVVADRTFLCYPDTTVRLTNQTLKNCIPQGNTNQRYEYWNFGNYWGKGTDSIINWLPFDPPIRIGYTIAYPGIGSYNVMMIDSNLCGRDTAYITINIVAPPIAALAGPDTVCAGTPAIFNNVTSGGANEYSWNFGAGGGWVSTGSGAQTYTYATSGTYTVQLAVNVSGGTSSCRDTVKKIITVLARPVALFTINNSSGCDSALVAFNNSSSGSNIVSYFWTFGNGQTSTLQNPPPMNYNLPGTYNIKLLVTNAQGCIHTNSKQVKVYNTPVANFVASNVCVGSLATFLNTSATVSGQPIISQTWNFGDGGTSTAVSPTHVYTVAGPYVVTLKVNTAFCSKTIVRTIMVEQKPIASFTSMPQIGCTPLEVAFTNTSLFGSIYNWDFGDGGTSSLANPIHTFMNTTDSIISYVIELNASNSFGCFTTFKDTIILYPAPIIDFKFDAAPACAPLIVNFTNNSTTAVSYEWHFGDGTTSTVTNPTHQYTNNTLFMINFNVSLIGTSINGCKDTITKQVGVFPEPNFGFSLSPDSGCAPLKVTFPSVLGAVLHDWDFGDGGTSTSPTPTHTFLNNTTNVKIYTIRLIATNAFGCKDTAFNSVKVYPNPTANFSMNKSAGCQPLEVEFQNNSIAATSVFWDFGDGTTSTSTAALLTHTYAHGINIPVNYSVKLVVTSVGGCKDSTIKVVKVYPVVKAKFSSDSVGCSPLPISFVNQSTTGSSSFWNFGDGFISAATNPNHTFINNGTVDSVYNVTLIATNANGCQDTVIRLVTVHPNPAVGFDVDKISGCQPFEVTITNTSTGATSYFWEFGDGTTSTTTNALFTHTYTHNSITPIIYTIRLTATSAFGCIKKTSKTVTVFPKISAAFTSNTIGCSPLKIKFTNQSSGAATYFWDFGDGFVDAGINPTHSFVNLTSSTIIYNVLLISTSANGCQDSAKAAITVFPSSQSIFTSDLQNGCQPLNVTFTNNSVNANTVLWNFGDGTTSTSLASTIQHVYSHNSPTATSYTVTLITNTINGCADTSKQVILVQPKIKALFTSKLSGCSPLTVKFTNNSVGALSYFWDFGDGGVDASANPTHVFVNSGSTPISYSVSMIATAISGCSDTATTIITVNPASLAAFTVDKLGGCQPLTVLLTNNSSNASIFSWDFGDGTTSTSSASTISHTYTHTSASSINYTIRLITNNSTGCSDTTTQNVLVQPVVTAAFTSINNGCSPLKVSFTNNSTGANSYLWTFGDGNVSISQNPTHTYNNLTFSNQNYTVTLISTAISGCKDTATKIITVYPATVAAFTVDNTSGCTPVKVNFTNTSTGASSYLWNFGDGSTSASASTFLSHTFVNTQTTAVTYTVTLITLSSRGCSDTATQQILVQPKVISAFSSISIGCSPLKVKFTNSSTGAISYLWDFGDATTDVSANPSHIFTNSTLVTQNYTVTLISTAISGCKDTSTKMITVYPASFASFTVDKTGGCEPLLVQFTNNSIGALSYFWDFGDGATSSTAATSLSHTFINNQAIATTYLVSLITISSNGCADTTTQPIVVQPKIIAGFTNINTGCAPLKVKFTNTSTGAISYLWDFGDATTDANASPTHTFTNLTQANQVFTVTLIATASSGCQDTITSQITVYPASQSIFSADKISGCQPLDVNFTNNSIGAGTSYWNFGDGFTLTSTASSVNHVFSHNFPTPVTYLVTLITNTSNGCADTSIQQILVQPKINAVFNSINDGCSPLRIAFTNNSTGANSYLWDFGDGNVDASTNPVHTFVNNTLLIQTFNVTLISTAASGCSDTLTKIITVYPETKPAFSTDFQTGCQPLFVNFTNTTQNAVSYLWDFGDGSTSTSSASAFNHTFVHNALVPQIFIVKLITISVNGCTDTVKQSITVFPKIEAKFIGSDSGCAPITINFTNESKGYVNSQWDFGDGFIDVANNPTHTFTNFTQSTVVYKVELIVTSLAGCQDTISKNITVFPKPDALFTAAELTGCQPFNAEFTNTSVGANQSRWDFGDGTIVNDTASIIRHTFQHNSVSPVQYNVKLLITNANGCTDTLNRLILVNPKLSARFISDSIGCSPYKVDFNNLSTGTANYNWDFGDGFTDVVKNTKHTFVNNSDNDTIFNVRLISGSVYGCYDTVYKDITVHPSPKIDFLLSGNSGCQPFIVTIKNKTKGASNQTWDFGDGNSIQSSDSVITHSYSHSSAIPVSYKITVRVDNLQGCSDTSSKSITVLPELKAAYTFNKNDCSPVTASFINSSTGATGYQWNFGDGRNDVVPNPVHTFYNNGIADTTYRVRMIALSPFGCIDTTFRNVVVAPAPKAAFKIDGDELMQPNTTAIITNTSKAGSWTYKWSWGDGTFSTLKDPGTHTYLTYGDFEIVLIQKSQYCADTTKQSLRINPAMPVASFKGEASGCKPVVVQFSNTSTYATEFFWEFGDGGTSTQSDPSYVYYRPGKYAVKLTAIGPGGKSEKVQLDSIEVFELPTALFVVNPTIVFLPDKPAVFYNLSTDDAGSTYEWDFGDGSTSFEESPEHYYKKVGSFTITLKVTNAAGCVDTYILENAVVAESKGEVSVPNAFTPNPSGPSGGIINPSDMSNDIFYPVIIGAEQFHLTVFNRWGELIFESFDQQVGWDGYYRNEMCLQDVYVWKVEGVFVDGRKFAKLGDVTLLR